MCFRMPFLNLKAEGPECPSTQSNRSVSLTLPAIFLSDFAPCGAVGGLEGMYRFCKAPYHSQVSKSN